MKDKSVFVFYTIHPDARARQWVYPRFPAGWKWIGAGSVNPVRGAVQSDLYEQEEQFEGPVSNRQEMREVIDRVFRNLKQKGIIIRYKIRNSYLP